MGSDAASRHRQRGRKVSIRAPAWGATTEWIGQILSCHVSIRAPAWGATGAKPLIAKLEKVSIRAPAWGAT